MSEKPTLGVREPVGEVRAVALVLHGGRVKSRVPASPWQPAALRMIPFAWVLQRAGRDQGLAVCSLGYRLRGWNGAEASPVPDARWALDRVRERYGEVPVVLVGHSMGARTALRVADDPHVRGVVALAPWLPDGEPAGAVAGREILIMHGANDRTTEAAASRAYAKSAPADRIALIELRDEGHAMLRRAGVWHRLTTGFVLGLLGFTTMPKVVEVAWSRALVI
ncbi:MAG: alpha/beta hydrolase [Actinomycetia bacterium]|nr:alpha/beta hydrolase [Actinomycetes bacterium]